MKRRFTLIAAIAAVATFGAAGTASAAGQLCTSVNVNVNGQELVNDQRCTQLP